MQYLQPTDMDSDVEAMIEFDNDRTDDDSPRPEDDKQDVPELDDNTTIDITDELSSEEDQKEEQ